MVKEPRVFIWKRENLEMGWWERISPDISETELGSNRSKVDHHIRAGLSRGVNPLFLKVHR